MASNSGESPPKKKRKKGPHDEIKKNVVILKSSQVFKKNDEVFMPTTIDMANVIKKSPQQCQEVCFTKSMTSEDLQKKLMETFPILAAAQRFCCARSLQKTKLDFCGKRSVWSGEFINKKITGNSVLYVYCEEEDSSLEAQMEHMQISKNVDSSDTCSDSGFETSRTSRDISRRQRGDPLLSSARSPEASTHDEASANVDVQLSYPIDEDVEKECNNYSLSEDCPLQIHYNAECEETNQDAAKENFSYNAEGEETDQDAAQENSHYNAECEETKQDAAQENLVRQICPPSGPVEGHNNFVLLLHEDLPDDVDCGMAYFGDNLAVLEKINKTFTGVIPAAQQPGVVKVLVYTATNQFIGEVNFTYEDEMVRVVQQAVKHGPKRMAKLFELLQMHFEEGSCDMPNTGSSGQAMDALNDSCMDRSSSAENIAMADGYEDLAQHFQYVIKCLSEERCSPTHSSTNVWLQLSKAVGEICKQLARTEDEHNFKGNQLACSQESDENYFADAENSSCVSSEVGSDSLSDSEDWDESINEPMKTDENAMKDVSDAVQDLNKESGFSSEEKNSQTQLTPPDNTPILSLVPEVENKESQYQNDEPPNITPDKEKTKLTHSASTISTDSNQQSVAPHRPSSPEAAQYCLFNPFMLPVCTDCGSVGQHQFDTKLNMAPPQSSAKEFIWEKPIEDTSAWYFDFIVRMFAELLVRLFMMFPKPLVTLFMMFTMLLVRLFEMFAKLVLRLFEMFTMLLVRLFEMFAKPLVTLFMMFTMLLVRLFEMSPKPLVTLFMMFAKPLVTLFMMFAKPLVTLFMGTDSEQEIKPERERVLNLFREIKAKRERVSLNLFQDVEKIHMDLSYNDGASRGVRDAFPNATITSKAIFQDCRPKHVNLKLKRRENFNDNVADVALVKVGDSFMIAGDDGLRRPPDYRADCEGLILRKPKA